MATVGVPRILRYHLGEEASARVEGATIGEVLDNLFGAYPLLARHVTDEQGNLRAHVVLALNGTVIGARPDPSRPVGPDDEVQILQAVSGG